jgi:hypothetical protein
MKLLPNFVPAQLWIVVGEKMVCEEGVQNQRLYAAAMGSMQSDDQARREIRRAAQKVGKM